MVSNELLNQYAACYARIKAGAPAFVSNIFQNAEELAAIFINKPCKLVANDQFLFIFIPRHDSFYELLFACASPEIMGEAVKNIRAIFPVAMPIRVSLAGREPSVGNLATIFLENGFTLAKKLLRTRLGLPSESIRQAMAIFAQEHSPYLGFAKSGDEGEIMEILKQSFDPIGDNLPEIDEIRERIAKRQIAVLRKDHAILSLRYYSLSSTNILHSYYDVTRPEYRGGNGYFMALCHFVQETLGQGGIHVKRALGWREEAKKKLVKHAKKSNEQPDGIVIYNLRLDPAES